jgi:plastocyanin
LRSTTAARRRPRAAAVLAAPLLIAATITIAPGTSSAAPAKLVVGVDHTDPANNGPAAIAKGRLFEYTDFFTRSTSVHRGDTLDLRTAAGEFHIIGLGPTARASLKAYPVALADHDDGNARPAGTPKLLLGPSNFPVTGGSIHGGGTVDITRPNGPPVCGRPDLGEKNCVFKGGDDVEIAGANVRVDSHNRPLPADWNVTIDAPVGTYQYFCAIHPGMVGTLHVVSASQPASTQAAIDRASVRQFNADRNLGLGAESVANRVRFTGGRPGTRTYIFSVGINAGSRVAIDEMFPNRPVSMARGDKALFVWADPHNVHSVFFPNTGRETPPFVFDCGDHISPAPNCHEPGEPPELIADPGADRSGVQLTRPAAIVDSGVNLGKAYGVPSPQRFVVDTSASTTKGTYAYHCTVHDFMTGHLIVG